MTDRRPYFAKVIAHDWATPGRPSTPGIAFIGRGGLSAHLTPAEAISLSNHIVDLVESLEKEN
ncbi:hypothetical protein J2X01_000721 [Arthrobacter ginsengisoli]|uniref:Uncharacterized protein n=1 Tax=Arthrobacter ginsengisoli TaxID=1356565 RepID=A0ABU1U8F4_9MICC|nr:hypothetical protein [Arthrobacter ginsengisoli]MDR7081444.1 hypothetical protein [Arthrobacter ginsengisoli]